MTDDEIDDLQNNVGMLGLKIDTPLYLKLKDGVAKLVADLEHMTKARDELARVARLLADGESTPSAVEVRGLIDALSKVGDQ